MPCWLTGKFSIDINIFRSFFSPIIVTFPISIIHCTNYSIISYPKFHIKPTYISFCSAEKKKKKKICTLKVISEDLRQYSNGSADTAAEQDLPNREKRRRSWFHWGIHRVALHHGNSYLSPCSESSEGWGCLSDTNYLSIGVWGWVFQAQWSEVAVARCQHQLLQQYLTLHGQSLPDVHTFQGNHLSFCSWIFAGQEGKEEKQQGKERESNQ